MTGLLGDMARPPPPPPPPAPCRHSRASSAACFHVADLLVLAGSRQGERAFFAAMRARVVVHCGSIVRRVDMRAVQKTAEATKVKDEAKAKAAQQEARESRRASMFARNSAVAPPDAAAGLPAAAPQQARESVAAWRSPLSSRRSERVTTRPTSPVGPTLAAGLSSSDGRPFSPEPAVSTAQPPAQRRVRVRSGAGPAAHGIQHADNIAAEGTGEPREHLLSTSVRSATDAPRWVQLAAVAPEDTDQPPSLLLHEPLQTAEVHGQGLALSGDPTQTSPAIGRSGTEESGAASVATDHGSDTDSALASQQLPEDDDASAERRSASGLARTRQQSDAVRDCAGRCGRACPCPLSSLFRTRRARARRLN